MISQNDIEYLQDMVEREQMTADEANVEKVLTQRVLIVKSLPKTVRAALNAAVRDGKLRHKRKEGRKPEVYYHPNFEYLANAERKRVERETLVALIGVIVPPEGEEENRWTLKS